MSDLRAAITNAILDSDYNRRYRCIGPYSAQQIADHITDTLIDLAGHGQLLKAIDRTHR